jgi:hypothetical protein
MYGYVYYNEADFFFFVYAALDYIVLSLLIKPIIILKKKPNICPFSDLYQIA